MKNIKIIILLSLLFSVANAQTLENKKIPDFPVFDVYDNRHSILDLLKDLPDKGYLILNFTSMFCKPCKKEIPELMNISDKFKNRIKIIYIYSEINNKEVINDALKLGIKNNELINVCTDLFSTIKKEQNVKSVPYTILISKNGDVLNRIEGYTEKNIKIIYSLLEATK
ncbi:MAG: TlpA disulfide reductase family protein [Spirochaetota bacterium]